MFWASALSVSESRNYIKEPSVSVNRSLVSLGFTTGLYFVVNPLRFLSINLSLAHWLGSFSILRSGQRSWLVVQSFLPLYLPCFPSFEPHCYLLHLSSHLFTLHTCRQLTSPVRLHCRKQRAPEVLHWEGGEGHVASSEPHVVSEALLPVIPPTHRFAQMLLNYITVHED